jgi:23S rRNA (adenine2503-C2)-methyltransferase
MKPAMLDMSRGELRAAVAALGHKGFRADQLADWVYRKGVTDVALMTNLPAGLAEAFDILPSQVARQALSNDDTIKLLLRLADDEHVECVLIPTEDRATACVSTQAGCAMGCTFCASAMGGLKRNLACAEILGQILHLRQAAGRAVTHVVFMGMGEPLANYDATAAAVRAIVDPDRFGISARRVTVSTVGLPAQIRRLAAENIPITLAISLHAPDDALRRKLIPAATAATIDEILDAAAEFQHSRNREVTLEYLLLAGVNDTPACAKALAERAHRLRCNVNLIRYNPVESLPFQCPSGEAVEAFADILRERDVNTQVRRSRGLDAAAACGQLRRRAAQGQ